MSASHHNRHILFGLVELDAAGMVLYSRLENGNGRSDLTGYNFFSEVAPFKNVEEFRRRLDEFREGSQQADAMDFNCHYEDGPVRVRVLLARIRDRSERAATKSILLHIRKAS